MNSINWKVFGNNLATVLDEVAGAYVNQNSRQYKHLAGGLYDKGLTLTPIVGAQTACFHVSRMRELCV